MSLLTVLLTLVVSLLGGYAFARFRFPGKDLLFLSTLAILMVPYATLLIPLYVMLNAVGLSNSLVGVALVLSMFQLLPFSMFMMRISFSRSRVNSTRPRWSTDATAGACCGRCSCRR